MLINKFSSTLLELWDKRHVEFLKDFINNDQYTAYWEKVEYSIKIQKSFENVLKIDKTPEKFDLSNTHHCKLPFSLYSSIIVALSESFESYIQPVNYKGKKAAMITLQNNQGQKMKQSLLINQSVEICAYMIDIIKMLEKDLIDYDIQSNDSVNEENMVLKKNMLKIVNKAFNEFLYIKNVFEIESGDLRKEVENFALKEYFLYSIDLLLSLKQKSKIKITIDPMIPEEVKGDLVKFRQIITTILDFSFKSTGKITITLTSKFVRETGGIIIFFLITFSPKFEINDEELTLLFGEKEDMFLNQSKLNKLVGLSVHVLPELVKFLGGEFTQLKHTKDNKIVIEFSIPFDPIFSAQIQMNKTPDITMNIRGKDKKGNILFATKLNNGITYNRSTFNQSKNSMEMSVVKDSMSDPSEKSMDVLGHEEVSGIRDVITNYDTEMINRRNDRLRMNRIVSVNKNQLNRVDSFTDWFESLHEDNEGTLSFINI